MFIDLLDALRCPAGHDETWLVARIDRMEGRYIAEGSLGCPVCRREYPIHDFIAYFATEPAPAESSAVATRTDALDDRLTRLAALLDLAVPGGFVGLAGESGADASALALAFEVQAVLINPPRAVAPGEGCSVLRCIGRAPLAAGSLRALACDAPSAADEALFASLVRAVGPGGRLLAPVSLPRPAGVKELARDGQEWVGVSDTPATIIPLSRGGPAPPAG